MLAAAGLASRRTCETIISSGRISVNGKVVTELGTKVDPQTDEIRVDGEQMMTAVNPKPLYVMLHKPIGYVCTVSDPHAEHTVLELLEQLESRVYPVGRLDADSSGLLLLTNDGDFANRLTHPRYHVPKVYRVRVRGFLDRTAAIKLSEGVELPDGKTAPANLAFVEYDNATQCTIVDMTLYEGRNRQVRRMMDLVGHPVRELQRIAFGCVQLKGLNTGTWRKLKPDEVSGILAMARPVPTPSRASRSVVPSFHAVPAAAAKLPPRPRGGS